MITKALASAGAKKVYILGRRQSTLEAAASAVDTKVVIPIVCDVTSKPSLQSAVDAVAADAGYINLLVANSGILGPYQSYDASLSAAELRKRLFDDVDPDDFTDTLRVNITGAYLTIFAFLELLDKGNQNALSRDKKHGYGQPLNEGSHVPRIQSQVVVTASVGSYSRERATPPAYSAAKGGVLQMAKHAASGLAPYSIRVNILAPGWYESEMAAGIMSTRDPETEEMNHPDFMPARRFGVEDEVRGTILYLASKAGAYCNGSVHLFDGGRLAVIPSSY
ncbi:short-chain dehydrogenase [Xylariaceae sp. FL0255]|nr:short-chain dehydrogenase [Xylariaceae sp. FL0255]